MIFRTPFFLPWLYPQLVWKADSQEKKIFLTFDDGPVPGATEFVLETLKKFKAKATFFCIGDNVGKHPLVFKKIIDDNHAIGNHTFNHLKGWNYSTQEYIGNIERCSKQLNDSGVHNLSSGSRQLFRPPYGRIKKNQIKALNNYRIIMWDVLTHDYARSCSPERCLDGSLKATRPGSIVVFHDSLKAERNLMYALPRYMEHFYEKGFSFESL
jgi:peptidoglycan-N-acetylglucosamine deacetylase